MLARRWQRRKFDAGYAGITIPRKFGGAGGTDIQKIIFHEEEGRFDLPFEFFAVSLGMPIPIVLHYSSEEERQRFIPAALKGDEIWCQLFSEPAAGSDLAALRTTAERDGDGWRINGQKLWTSYAQVSDYGVIVARTDRNAAKHRGLTYFWIDMRSPGILVRPVKKMTGLSEVNEVFFDNVFVPDSQRYGEVNQGFAVAMHTLMVERFSVLDMTGWAANLSLLLSTLNDRMIGGRPALEDSAVRDLIADVFVEQRALANINTRALAAIAAGGEPGPEGSINKLLIASKRQRLARIALDLIGPQGVALARGETARTDFAQSWLDSPSLRIAGGSDEILRNTIAEKILGLPQDHRPDKGIPFKDIR